MRESIERALVVDKIAHRELDHLVTLYSQDLGLIRAHLKSSRRPISKLNAHLEPLNLVDVRLVKNHHRHITDALTVDRLASNASNAHAVAFLKDFFSEESPDESVWQIIAAGFENPEKTVSGKSLLSGLGFHTNSARCNNCNLANPPYFSPLSYYLCEACALDQAIRDRCLII